MKAIILVGGEGTRLRPLTYQTPKQMLTVAGRPILEWVIAHLASNGVSEVVLALGYLPDHFIAAYPNHEVCGVPVSYVVEPHPLDTAGALHHAAASCGIDETFVVMNGDVMTKLSLATMIHFHRQRRAEATIAVRPVPDPSAFGVVDYASDGVVRAFVEKPVLGSVSSNHINAGVYVLEASVLERIEPSTRVSLERIIFPELARDQRLYAHPTDEYWIDTGTPATYLQANLDALKDQHALLSAPPRDGSSYGPNCSIHATASIVSSVIGAGVRVESNAVIEESVLLDGAVVSANAVVHRSIVGPGAVVPTAQHLNGDVIVGESLESFTKVP